MTTLTMTNSPKPWYRHRWPWILIAGPLTVVVASMVTVWLAVSTSDGLVTDDYYKKGLAVGTTLAQSSRAEQLGLEARMRLTADAVRVQLTGKDGSGFVPPAALNMTLSHPTRAGLDLSQRLRLEEDAYVGKLRLPASGHWLVLVEDEEKSWRLMASVTLPASGETVIGGAIPADIRN